jgi:hypothetical protein
MKVKCDFCGKEFDYNDGSNHYNRTKKHYCCRVCQGFGNNVVLGNVISKMASKRNGKKPDKKYRVWCCAKKRAKQKGTEFSLTVFDIPEIPKICPVLGIKIVESKKYGPIDSSPSLDRIDPKKGYVVGNVRIICNRANRIKSDATLKELELILQDAKNIQNKNTR